MKENSMKSKLSVLTLIGLTLAGAGATGQAQILGFAGEVNGAVSAGDILPTGCPTRICTTNIVTRSFCFTNWEWERICVTNAAGGVQCTNMLVSTVHCYTNTFPEITCTNVFLTPTGVAVRETLTGALSETLPCDQLTGLFPSDAVFEASLYVKLRTNDWVGKHTGFFRILSGTNVLAFGSLSGVNGVRTHALDESCALCNHFQGMLRGFVSESGPLHGINFEADYSAN